MTPRIAGGCSSVACAALLACMLGCGSADDASAGDEADLKGLHGVTHAEREHYIHTAQVWMEGDIASRDLLAGPREDGAFAFDEAITCDFVEPREKDELGGASPKFSCAIGKDKVKVKYSAGPDDNGEIYAEVMSSRLLWALGFGADKNYPVRVTCRGCPEDPWAAYRDFEEGDEPKGGERKDRTFEYALIERKFEGAKIEEDGHEDQGWGWNEIAHDFASEGGAPLAHIDAFKLLAVFIKHADNKAANQRLVCLPEGVTSDGKCDQPLLMIQDGGSTFGGGAKFFGLIGGASAKARFQDWLKPVWKDEDACQGLLRDWANGSMTHPHIGEAGRKFLADLLVQLSDTQIRDLFVASRIEERGETLVDQAGHTRPVTVDDWVQAFRRHRDEIVSVACP